MEEGKEAPGPPKRFDLRTRLMELSPIVIIGVIIAAIAIGFIARDITVTRGPGNENQFVPSTFPGSPV